MKYLGIDWGLKRVGLAVSEGEIASPLDSLSITSVDDGINKVMEVIKKEQVDEIVIGKPEGEMGKAVERAVQAFAKKGVNLIEVDETLSSYNAKNFMLQTGFSKKMRQDDNAVAAAIILQNYLDEK